jgi:hypothetical protein
LILGEPEIAKSKSNRDFVTPASRIGQNACGQAVQIRIVWFPEPGGGNGNLRFKECLPGLQCAAGVTRLKRFSAGGRGDSELQIRRDGGFHRIEHEGQHVENSCLRVGLGDQFRDIDRRTAEQLDGPGDPAMVERCSDSGGGRLVAMGDVLQRQAVDRLICRIRYANSEDVPLARPNRIGDVQHERVLSPVMGADALGVDPDFRSVIDRLESDEMSAI